MAETEERERESARASERASERESERARERERGRTRDILCVSLSEKTPNRKENLDIRRIVS